MTGCGRLDLAAWRRRLWIAPALASALALVAGCNQQEPQSTPPPAGQPTQVTEGYHTTQTRDGVMQWELWGNTAERFPGQQALHLNAVRMVFYRAGIADATLTSSSAEVDEQTKNMTARGNVRVINTREQLLESEVLHWDDARQRIHTDEFVKFTDGDQVLTGYGLETDPDLTDLTLRERVEGNVPDSARRQVSQEQRP
jgi:LPS export ABC transporter protein LptC